MIRFAVAAAAVALLSGANGCCACSASKDYERRGATSAVGPAVSLAPPIVRALHFGDFGEANCQQAAVAAGIADAQRRKPFDLAFHAGDNLYECGADWRSTQAARCAFASDGNTVAPGYVPPHDPDFKEKFEEPLGALSGAGVPVYMALGNHDVATWGSCLPIGDPVAVARAKACLEVAHRAPAWTMPARRYVIDRGPARFVVLDSNLVAGDYGGFTLAEEVAFLSAASAGCDAIACFVVAHHPPATAGGHVSDFNPAFTARMEQLVAAGGGKIRAWLTAHDHDLQHVRTAGGLDVFVSGNGSRDRTGERFDRTAPAGATLLYGTVRWGHAILEVAANGFTWRVEDDRGSPRYCCAAALSDSWSACDPVPCE
jgi:tartrate-resistant acid phosphatase type 5